MATNTDFIVKNGLVVTDSATFGNTITGTNAIFTGTVTANNILDSAQITAIATANSVDSAYVTAQVDALIDGAPGTLDTLNEIAAALNDDDSAYGTLIGLINAKSDLDSAQVSSIITADVDQAFVNALNIDADNLDGQSGSFYLDYTNFTNTPTVDSAYVQARQDFAYASLTGAPNVLDSADVTNIVDSAYIQARQITGGGGTVDSAYVLSVVDSGVIPFTQKFYHFTADSGQLTFTGADDDTETLAYTSEALAVYLNGILLIDSVDYTASNGTSIILTDSATNGDVLTVLKFGGNTTGIDSADVINLIDSAYVQARQDFAYSSLTGKPTFADSAYVTSQINSLIDAAPASLDTLNELAAALGDDANFSATVTNLIATKVDSAQVSNIIIADVDSAFVEALDVPEATFGIVNNGTSAYTFSGDGFSSTADNPTLYLTRGHTYKFSVNASGHPLQIRVSNGGSAYNTGVTNNGAATGDVIFTPDMSTPKNLVYQCTVHSGMVGDIVVLDGVIPNGFSQVHVSGQDDVVADSGSDILTFEAGPGISITTDLNTDTITIINDLNADIARSIIDSAYVQEHQTHYLDSALVTQLIDSAYVTARAPAGGGGGGSGTVDSAQTISLIEATVDSDYILDKVDFARGEFTLDRWSYTATASQTVFTGTDNNGNTLAITDTGLIEVYLNGILLVDSDDYSATTSSVTLTSPATVGYNIQIMERRGRVLTQRGFQETKYYYTTATPTTIFTGADDNGAILNLSDGHSDVFVNGFLLKDSDDYSTTSTTVTLVSATDSGDLVTIGNRKGTVVTPTLKTFNYTADSNQSLISGADATGATLSYVSGQVQLFVNGILLRNDLDFTASNGSTITLGVPLDLSDDVVVATYSAPGVIVNQYRYLASANQTVFNGLDINAEFLSYDPANVQVFLNGMLLTDSDYTANNGLSVILSSAASLNDDIIISAYTQGVAQLRTNLWSAPTGTPVQSYAGDKLFIDTSTAKTVTLPSSASMGDEIRIIDATGNAATNNITVARNGHKIQGSATDLTININRAAIGLVYYNATQGWVLIEN